MNLKIQKVDVYCQLLVKYGHARCQLGRVKVFVGFHKKIVVYLQ